MFLFDYISYFRPHVWRIVFGIFFMMCVGFFSAANLIAAKPVIEIIIGEMTYEKYQEYLAKKQAKPVTTPKTAFAQWWRDQTQPLKDWRDRQVEGFYEWASNSANRLRALLYVSMVIFSFTLIKCFSEYWSKYLLSFTLFTVGLGIKENLFAHVMAQDAAFFQGKTTGFLESRINSDVKVLERLFEALIREAIQEPITITALLGVLFYLNWQLTLIALVVLPIAGLPLAHFSRRLRKMTRKSQRENDMLFSHAEEALRNYRIVKVYHSEEFEVRRFKKRNAKLFYYFLKQRVASFSQSPIMETMGMLGAIGVLMYGGMAVTGTKPLMTGSDFIIYLVCLTQFYTPIRKLAKINTQWQGGKVSAERIREIFSLKSTVTENENALPLERIQRGIQFDHVTFCYHETPVLDDITFEIPLGKTVAIVGRSGAGKTSLVNLIPRLYDPSEGAVLVDGRSATDCRLQDLRRCFGFVTQDTILFNDTVTRNIAYAEREAIDMRRVEEAARLAHAHEFILALEGGLGYETVIGQAGQRLSGGQRQRLAIARAIYRDPQILIFDEATSALDEESQRHVQEAIDNLLKHRTAIIIAHRLSTIRNADIIIVMDKGKIIETGNHDALMAQQGLYWSLYSQGTIE